MSNYLRGDLNIDTQKHNISQKNIATEHKHLTEESQRKDRKCIHQYHELVLLPPPCLPEQLVAASQYMK